MQPPWSQRPAALQCRAHQGQDVWTGCSSARRSVAAYMVAADNPGCLSSNQLRGSVHDHGVLLRDGPLPASKHLQEQCRQHCA